jgi:ATP-dependent protease ClpP protease subunit
MLQRFVLPALLAICLHPSPALAGEEESHVYLADGELNYVGSLSAEANAKLFALYSDQQTKPTTLAIRSPGGNTVAGMELGKWVHENKLDVKVLEGCYSSCANYVFTAGRRKIVSNFAHIGFHGGMSSMSFKIDDASVAALADAQQGGEKVTRENVLQMIKKMFAPQLEQETNYFAMIGVQQRITTLGQSEKARKAAPKDAEGWTYSIKDFAKLGVTGIEVINPPWRPDRNPSRNVIYKLSVE